jgi:hypothetical protein
VLTAADEEELKKPRSTFDETVDFICKEALLAEKDLPHSDEYDTSDFGRITKGACYALISRVRLMAASPLYNDPQQPEDTPFHILRINGVWQQKQPGTSSKRQEDTNSTNQQTRPGMVTMKIFLSADIARK